MKTVLIIAVAAALAVTALAFDFVREGFEGPTFPPAGWKMECNGTSWVRRVNGPWGSYAHVGAYCADDEVRSTNLYTYGFGLPAQTEIYYGFYYSLDGGGTGGGLSARFYITYVDPPGGYLVNRDFLNGASWEYFSGSAFNRSAARVKASWQIWCLAEPKYYMWIDVDLDRVTITDGDPHAVAPASLGKVKALFR